MYWMLTLHLKLSTPPLSLSYPIPLGPTTVSRLILWYCPTSHSAPQSQAPQFSSVQSLSCVWLFVTRWTAARQPSLSITNSQAPHCSSSTRRTSWPQDLCTCCLNILIPCYPPFIQVSSWKSCCQSSLPGPLNLNSSPTPPLIPPLSCYIQTLISP